MNYVLFLGQLVRFLLRPFLSSCKINTHTNLLKLLEISCFTHASFIFEINTQTGWQDRGNTQKTRSRNKHYLQD